MSLWNSTSWYQEPYEVKAPLSVDRPRLSIDDYGWKATFQCDDFSTHSRSKAKYAACKCLGYKELRARYGPIPTSENNDLNKWITELDSTARSLNFSKVHITPSFHSFTEDESRRVLFDEAFAANGYTATKFYSPILDLSQSEDDLFKSIKSEVRRKTRRAMEAGVTIKRVENIEQMKEQLATKHNNKKTYVDFFKTIIDSHMDNYCYYYAECNGKPLAWQGVRFGPDVALLENNTISPSIRKTKIFANHALQWNIILLAKSKGVRWLDWVGAEPESLDPKLKGIFKFKMSWGGSLVEYNTYSKTLSPMKEQALETIKSTTKITAQYKEKAIKLIRSHVK